MINELIKLFRKSDIKSLFLLVGIVLIGIQTFFILFYFKKIQENKEYIEKTYNKDFMVAKFASHAKYTFLRLENILERTLATQDNARFEENLSILEEFESEFTSDLEVLKDRTEDSSELKIILALVSREFSEYKRVEKTILELKRKKMSKNFTNEWEKYEIKRKLIELLDEIDDFVSEKSYLELLNSLEQIENSKNHYLLYAGIVLLSFLMAFYLFDKIIIRPLKKVSMLFSEIASGQFEKRLYADQFYSNVYILAESFSKLQSKFLESLLKEESAKKALSAFLSNMSHELRTPLVSIIGFSGIAIEEINQGKLSEKSEKNFDQIRKSGEHLLALINDILDLSKLNSGDFTINESKIDLIEATKDALYLLEGKAKEKDLKIDLTVLGKQELIVIADDIRVKQVVINLVNNAIKFTHEGGVYITIRPQEVEKNIMSVMFEIRDTGIGIPKDKQQEIFRSFAQAGVDSNESYTGTGLGLSISKNLIERMGGRIWVESVPGIGSSFFFTLKMGLPNVEKNIAHNFNETEEEVKDQLRPLDPSWKLLVVEDDDSAFAIVQHFLKKLGFQNFDHASSGELAIIKGENNKYDLILMDMNLPDMSGPKVTEQLKEKLGNSLPRVVAFTASNLESHKQRCFEAGMIGFISKPVSQNGLADGIRRAQNIPMEAKNQKS